MPSSRNRRIFPSEGPARPVEVIDASGRPLMIMPLASVVRQNLRHKAVIVCLRDAKGRMFVHKRPPESGPAHAGTWTAAAGGPVLEGESFHDAAERLLAEDLGLENLEKTEVDRLPSSQFTGNRVTAVFLTGKTSAMPRVNEGMYVDREELMAILRDYPHLTTPNLRLAAHYI